MYYSNDIGTSMLTMGRDHVAQAATQPSFVQFQVWDEASLDIDPGDANLRYYNDESGDYRSQIQGFACVLAPDTLADNITYGNLYIEYDVEFYSARMTQTISHPSWNYHWDSPDLRDLQQGGPVDLGH